MAKEQRQQVIPEEIRSLLAQRHTYQEWLRRLDDVGSEFRPEVTGRVRDDYRDRLGHVESDLAGHRAVLESSLVERRESLDILLTQHDQRTAELEECELRHRVGEYDDGEWGRRRDEHQGVLDGLEGSLGQERQAVSELESVLSELSGESTARPAGAAAAAVVRPQAGRGRGQALPEPSDEPGLEPSEPEDAPPDEPLAPDEGQDEQVLGVAVATGDPEPGRRLYADQEVEPSPAASSVGEGAAPKSGGGSEVVEVVEEADFMDELEFLESLSLDDAESFDAVSAMLDEEGASEDEDEGSVADR